MSVRNEKHQKPLRPLDFLECQGFFAGNRGNVFQLELLHSMWYLQNIILTEEFIFAVKKNNGVEYQRIGKNCFPTWNFRTMKIQAFMQKSENIFSFGSSSRVLSFDCDFDCDFFEYESKLLSAFELFGSSCSLRIF